MRLGDRVTFAQQTHGVTDRILALKAGLTESKLARIKAGALDPTTAQTIRLGFALDLSPSYLRGEDSEAGLFAEPGFKLLVRKLEALTPNKRRELLTIFCQSFTVAERIIANEQTK
jgi:transcriptional regulator with XRE-family HTH domain